MKKEDNLADWYSQVKYNFNIFFLLKKMCLTEAFNFNLLCQKKLNDLKLLNFFFS